MAIKEERDIEKGYPKADFVAKLRRLADAIERDERFEIQIAGERIYIPVRAQLTIEHERSDDEEEVEFQIKWAGINCWNGWTESIAGCTRPGHR